ncbi:hypothetical protein [Natronoglycomyces albus]|uniref:Uncharacterized protein n=1 Tax=Natronoglycomyces albus TaxID=2811108 RepID=A0A895XJC8_9ACTN|nr:hypothetical protein [Natronoglycomyces albus]QSB05097.1 hypothetical protein JQS30_15265 [Natronoglycomyces albus]
MRHNRFRIPKTRIVNGRKPSINAISRASTHDLWGTYVEPGKYYGRFLSDNQYFYLYGSWRGDSISVHREENRDGEPVARFYLTPLGGWWMQPCVWGDKAKGLSRLNENFQEYLTTHSQLRDL